MTRTALVLRHVLFEDLGTFGPVLNEAGYAIRYVTVGDPGFPGQDPIEPDLLVILGGPIGVYEDAIYPFLKAERAFITKRLETKRPTLGICLGAQLIASSLGVPVFPAGVKEIGFAPIDLTEAGRASPLRHLDGVPVLHWHGDTYALPQDATNLASTTLVQQQAFSIGETILGVQFHPEAETGPEFERWLVGHAAELAGAGIDVLGLRQDAQRYGKNLELAAGALLEEWLAGLRGAR
ncbi:MAG: glutamine amidotransferase [Pseudomonadota bacterium]|jgi:GMP synthase (glutamine-hydrolysing)|nr:glutamine amidotransferase [Pseudomonadota bacterium]